MVETIYPRRVRDTPSHRPRTRPVRRAARSASPRSSGCAGVSSARARSCPSQSPWRSPACCASRALFACRCRSRAARCPSAGTTSCRCRCGRSATAPGSALGVLTYQPVATFLVVAVAAAASGPTAAVLALTALRHRPRRRRLAAHDLRRPDGDALPADAPPQRRGAGRARAGPRRRAGGRGARSHLGPGSQLDPAIVRDGTLAYTQRADNGTTAVRVRAADRRTDHDSRSTAEPSVRGEYLAYRDAAGVTVVKWRTRAPVDAPRRRLVEAGHQLAVPGRHPRSAAARERVVSIDLRTGKRRVPRRDRQRRRPRAPVDRPARSSSGTRPPATARAC